MSGITVDAKDAALLHLFERTTIALTRGGKVIDDLGYRGLNVEWSMPYQGKDDQGRPTDERLRSNLDDLRFGPWEKDATDAIDGYLVVADNGDVRVRQSLSRTEQPRRNDELVLYKGELIVGLK